MTPGEETCGGRGSEWMTPRPRGVNSSLQEKKKIHRPRTRAQGLGKMMTNTEVYAQDKAEDGTDLDSRDPRDEGRGSNRARPCMISSRDSLTFNFRLLFMQKYNLAQFYQWCGSCQWFIQCS